MSDDQPRAYNYGWSALDDRALPLVAEYVQHDWSARLLHRADASYEWELQWTDGINEWVEEHLRPWHAYARLAALVAAAERGVFLVHDLRDGGPAARAAFVAEAERFVSRTVHASSCRPGCDGTDPASHQPG